MADFTPQQKAVLTSTAKWNLVNAVGKTGKSQLLTRLYLNHQERPGEFKAIYLCSNSLTTKRVTDQLKRITGLDWSQQLIGTLAGIGFKLLQEHYQALTYERLPRIVPDSKVSDERQAAKFSASKLHADQDSLVFIEQWNQDFVQRLRLKNLASPRSLIIEATNLITRVSHAIPSQVRLLLADDLQDFTFDEMFALSAIQERMAKVFLAGNTNIAINDSFQDTHIDNWYPLVTREDHAPNPLTTCFGVGQDMGTFLHQLAAFNTKKLYERNPHFMSDARAQFLYEVLVPGPAVTVEVIREMEKHLQLGICNRLLGVVMRTINDARAMAQDLGAPCFIMWDKSQLSCSLDVPQKGVVVTTPYEAPYLDLDYVALPNCMQGYWPYQHERRLDNCRRQFLRAVSSARLGVAFLIPDPSNNVLVSPFVAEGCTPKLVTKTAQFAPAISRT